MTGTEPPSAVARAPTPLAHALAGAVGAVMAMTVLYPLDQVRAILQVDDELAQECSRPGGAGILGALSRIIRRHGRKVLWRGMIPVLITMGVSNFVYFYCFNGMKAALVARRRLISARNRGMETSCEGQECEVSRDNFPEGLSPAESTLASTVAGVANVLATTPLWVSNLRIKAGKGEGGLLRTMAAIGLKEGVTGLWSGVAPSLVLVSNPIIQFMVYEALKQAAGNRHHRRYQKQQQRLRQSREGNAAGAASSSDPSASGPGVQGSETAAVALDRTGGSSSEEGGESGPSTGLPSHEAFLLGATAKMVSTLATYPLQLAQVKLRAGQGYVQGRRSDGLDAQTSAVAVPGWRRSVLWQLLTCWSSTANILIAVCRNSGFSGLYQGMNAKLLHTVLTSALLFLGYERLVQVIGDALTPRETPSSAKPETVRRSGMRAPDPAMDRSIDSPSKKCS